MDNNVTKNTFFYKLLQLEFHRENLGLKYALEQQVFLAIAKYHERHSKVDRWQQTTFNLETKIILCPVKSDSWQIKYRCAVAFPIANKVNLSPLSVACDLVKILSFSEKTVDKIGLEITAIVSKSGWIDFIFSDRSINIWLDRLVTNITILSKTKFGNSISKESKKLDNLFPLQYIYNRCFSLLELGKREGTLVLKEKYSDLLQEKTEQKLIFKQNNLVDNLSLFGSYEKDLIWQICWMIDSIAIESNFDERLWQKSIPQISLVWSNFITYCNFCGEIKQNNPALARARLSLIALTYWCLQKVLFSQ